MRKSLFAFGLVALFALPAIGQDKKRSIDLGTLLNNIALNAVAATRTFNIGPTIGASSAARENLLDYSLLALTFNHSVNVSSTDIGMTCTSTSDGGTTKAALQDCTMASGVCTSNDLSWTKTVAAADVFLWTIDISGIKEIDCVVTSTGAAAGDKLTVTGYLVTD